MLYDRKLNRLTPDGQHLAEKLFDPAVATLTRWCKDGVASDHARYGALHPQVEQAVATSYAAREDLVLDVVVSALPRFMKNLDSGEIRIEGAATVLTLFIGACRNALVAIAERRHGQPSTEYTTAEIEDWMADAFSRHDPHPPDWEWLRKLLMTAPNPLRDVLSLMACGDLTFARAVRAVGANAGTTRSQLHRFRQMIVTYYARDQLVDIPEETEMGAWVRAHIADDGGGPWPG